VPTALFLHPEPPSRLCYNDARVKKFVWTNLVKNRMNGGASFEDLRVIMGSNWTIPTASVISSKPAMPQCKTSRAAKPPGEAIIVPSSFVTGGEGILP
jgi:hypothetical protein